MTARQLIVVLAVVALPATLTAAAFAAGQEDATAQSVAAAQEPSYGRGFALFQRYCRSCHGKKAEGDGHVAEYLKVAPTNLTRLAADNGDEFPTERVRKSIDGREENLPIHGRDMPIWGAVFQVDDGQTEADVEAKLADLIAYLEGIQVSLGRDSEQGTPKE